MRRSRCSPTNKPQEAASILDALLQQHEGLTLLHAALAQAADRRRPDQRWPRDLPARHRPVSAQRPADDALRRGADGHGRAKEAHALLLDLFNNVAPTPEQIRLTALAASAAGDTGDAYYYMSEYHIASGDLTSRCSSSKWRWRHPT